MSDIFLAYLRKERDRLDRALATARAGKRADDGEIASLRQQRRIVGDQLMRWTDDLSQERMAA